MRKLSVISSVMLAMALVATASGQDDAAGDLSLSSQWETGQTSRYQTSTKRVTVMQVKGMKKPASTIMNVTAEVTWKVLEADPDGGGRCQMKIEDMQVVVTDAKGQQHQATRRRADEPIKSIQPLIRAMIDHPISAQIDASGHVRSVSGWRQLKSAAGDAGKNLTEADFIESVSDLAVMIAPPGAPTAGGQWKEQFDWDHEMGTLELDSTYQLKSVETISGIPMATVIRKSAVQLDLDRSKLNNKADGPQRKVKLAKGGQGTHIMYDLSRNEVVGQHQVRDLVFQVDISFKGRQIVQLVRQRTTTQVQRLEEQ